MWKPQRARKDLIAELGHELVEWGEKLLGIYDDFPPDDGIVKPDDLVPRTALAKRTPSARTPIAETEHRDRSGKLMPCMICGSRVTLDGRYCARHFGDP